MMRNLSFLRFVVPSLVFCVSIIFAQQQAHASGWQELPNTKLQPHCPENQFNGYNYDFFSRCNYIVRAWGSAAFDDTQSIMYIWGGGHGDYYGNELYAIDLKNNSASRITDPGKPANPDANPADIELEPYDGTQPNSRHTYDGLAYIQHADQIWAFSGSLSSKASGKDNVTWLFDVAQQQWRKDNARGDIPAPTYGLVSAYDNSTGKIYLHDRAALYSYEYQPQGGTYSKVLSNNSLGLGISAAIDPNKGLMLVLGGGHQVIFSLHSSQGVIRTDIARKGDAEIIDARAPGLTYNPSTERFTAWFGNGKLYELNTDDMTWYSTAYNNDPGPQQPTGTFDRLVYSTAKQGLVLYNDFSSNAYLFKPFSDDDTQAPSVPANLSAKYPYPGALHLKWDAATDNIGIAGYRIFKGNEIVTDTARPEYKDFGIEPGTSPEYRVQAFDSAGNLSGKSATFKYTQPPLTPILRQGQCDKEPQLSGRQDIVLCESWDNADWWQNGYLSDPIVNDPRPMTAARADHTSIVSDGCIKGNCLKVDMRQGETGSLSAYWPMMQANLAPETLYLRYYLKLSDDWDVNMCNTDGDVVGAGGKFPGIADTRTWADPGGQCGNGGASADGKTCWSMRALYRDCNSGDGTACATKPAAAARFGSYLYHAGQAGETGDAGIWDNDDWGQSTGQGGSCGSSPSNLMCGKEDYGVLERGIWYQIEMQVTMNTPGQQDGEIRGWINGNLAYEKTNTVFRNTGHDFLHNRLIWLNIYKGGVQGNCANSSVYLDQMVVALDAPIGGLDSPTATPPTLSLSVDKSDVDENEPFTASWQSSKVSQCVASGLWEGNKDLQGQEQLSATRSGHLRLDCFGEGGSVARQLAVIVDGKPLPTPGNPDVPLPNIFPPTNLSRVDTNGDDIELTWQAASQGDAAVQYKVYMQDVFIGESNSNSFVHDQTLPGLTVNYAVTSVDANGVESAKSSPLTVMIPGQDPDLRIFLPSADTQLNSTTYKNQGDLTTMDAAQNSNLLLSFDLSSIPENMYIQEAKLVLHSLEEYGDSKIQIMAAGKTWSEFGATRDYAEKSAGLFWHQFLGDWTDASGQASGDIAYVSTTILDDDLPSETELDVTELVALWHSGELPNQGMLLKLVEGVNFRFASKENPSSNLWPKLLVQLSENAGPRQLHAEYQAADGLALSWQPMSVASTAQHRVYINKSLFETTTQASIMLEDPIVGVPLKIHVAAVLEDGQEGPPSNFINMRIPYPTDGSGDVIIPATADTMLNSTTHSVLGNKAYLDVSNNANGLLYFPSEVLQGLGNVQRVTLELQTLEEYGSGDIEVYAVNQAWTEDQATKILATADTRWDNVQGDWYDKNGYLQGSDAFASIAVVDDDVPSKLTLDVTNLVQRWITQQQENFGLLLINRNGQNFRLASRENANVAYRPKLRIETAH